MINYKKFLLDNTKLSIDTINIILKYIYQLEYHDNFKETLNIIKNIEYSNYNNYHTTILIEKSIWNSRKFLYTFCPVCKNYYKSTQIIYKENSKGVYKYTHYDLEQLKVIKNIYYISYDELPNWNSIYKEYAKNKYISCNCFENIV